MKTFFRVFSVICLVGWMGLIFYFSHQTADESSAVSGSVISLLAEKFYPDFALLSSLEQQNLISSLQGIVRSIAHFCIYGGLGFFAYLTFISYTGIKYKVRVFWMLEVCLLYAICDEFHQTFVDGRSMQLIDIVVDFGGVLSAVLICILFVFIVRPLHKRVAYKNHTSPKNPIGYNIKYEEYDYSLYVARENENKEQDIMIENFNIPEEKQESVAEEERDEKHILSEDFEYAAGIIGKTVIEATRVCNELTANSGDCDKKELVNLVLGRTEVLKSEILKIVSSNNDFQQKKDLMQKEQMAAYDYFDSIKAQLS